MTDIKENRFSNSNRMATDPIGRLLMKMSWPAVVSMTIGALYNMVDSIFVAMVGKEALTAVSIIMPLQYIIIAFNVGSGIGVNSLIARRLGENCVDDASQAASTSLRIGILNWLIFAIIGLLFAKSFMLMYTSNVKIYDYGVPYFTIVSVFSIFIAIEFQIEKVLQATGDMKAPMITSMSGAIVNLILDPLLIFGIGIFPRLEVMGAAIATVLGQAFAMSLAFWLFWSKEREVKIKIKGFKMDWTVVKDIYAVGFPSIIMQAICAVMLLAYNKIIAASDTAVAVLGVYFKLESFVFMPVFGLSQGAMPIMGYNYGARNKKRLLEVYRDSVIVALIVMIAGTLCFNLFPEILLRMFSADKQMMEMGVPALRRISLCFIPAAIGIMNSTLFQGTGHGMYSLWASFIRQLIGIIPIAWFLYRIGGPNLSWYSFPIAEILGVIYSITMAIILNRNEISKFN